MFSVVIPFRPNPNEPNRTESFLFVQDFWLHNFECEVVYGDSNTEQFNRSKARNDGVERAKYDNVILCDADTFCEKSNVAEAFSLMESTKRWVLPYMRYYRLSKPFSEHVIANRIDVINKPYYDIKFVKNSWSGVICLNKEMFDSVNGYNEDYQGWGYEDYEFKNKLDATVGPHSRTRGNSYHLWHQVEPNTTKDSPTYELNKTIYENADSTANNKQGLI